MMASGRIERLFIIVNVRAGGVRRKPSIVGQLREAVGSRGLVVTTDEPADIVPEMLRARRMNADAIGICGGDGSNVHTLSAIARVWNNEPLPSLLLLPGGTLNTAASNLSLTGLSPSESVRRVLASAEPRLEQRALLKVNGLIGFIFGAQMVARVLDTYYSGRADPLGAAWLGARLMVSAALGGPFARRHFQPDDIELRLENGPWQKRRLTALLASTVASPALKLRAMPRAGENGCFQMIGAECAPSAFVPELPNLFAGLPTRHLPLDVLARRVRLRLGEGARWTVDGDLFDSSEVQLEATAPVSLLIP